MTGCACSFFSFSQAKQPTSFMASCLATAMAAGDGGLDEDEDDFFFFFFFFFNFFSFTFFSFTGFVTLAPEKLFFGAAEDVELPLDLFLPPSAFSSVIFEGSSFFAGSDGSEAFSSEASSSDSELASSTLSFSIAALLAAIFSASLCLRLSSSAGSGAFSSP